jgi:hypothetical protein
MPPRRQSAGHILPPDDGRRRRLIGAINAALIGGNKPEHSRFFDFSAASMHDHWDRGYRQTKEALSHPSWLKMPANEGGIVIHNLHPRV